jgi:16S rRNA (uracil1498-N3)-methyltransferase
MPAERFYTTSDLIPSQEIFLEETEFHHLNNVMRAQAGDEIELINGCGILANAVITRIEKKRALITVQSILKNETNDKQIILVQALPRINRLDFIVEKGCELGMTELWIFPGERSERKELSSNQIDRLKSITIAAIKQCGSLFLPEIIVKPPIKKWPYFSIPAYYGSLGSQSPLLTQIKNDKASSQIIFCTGPEAGFTPEEEQKLTSLGAKGVKLHNNILRTDTASLAALALITHN